MIHIHSYEKVNEIHFGATTAAVEAVFGIPQTRRTNHDGEQELHFEGFVFRFATVSHLFREITVLPTMDASINDTQVVWDKSFLKWISLQDPDLKEALGFILSLRLGIAASGFHDGDDSQKAIHAFKKGDWDCFKHRMVPFKTVS